MKTATVVLKVEKRVNEANELEPNLYSAYQMIYPARKGNK